MDLQRTDNDCPMNEEDDDCDDKAKGLRPMDYPKHRSSKFRDHPGKVKISKWIKIAADEYEKADRKTFRTTQDGEILRSKEQIAKDMLLRLEVEYGGEFKKQDPDTGDWVLMDQREATKNINYGFSNLKKHQQAQERSGTSHLSQSSDHQQVRDEETPPTHVAKMEDSLWYPTSAQVSEACSDMMSFSLQGSVGTFPVVGSSSVLAERQEPREETHRQEPPVSSIEGLPRNVIEEIHAEVMALSNSLSDERFVEATVISLAGLTVSIENEPTVLSAGDLDVTAVKILIRATQLYPRNIKIQANAVWALSNLTDFDDNRSVLIEIGGDELIGKLAMGMAPFSEEEGQQPAAAMFFTISDDDEARVKSLLQEMRASDTDKPKQMRFCRVLGNLAVNHAFVAPIVRAGGIDLVLASMRRFPTSDELQRQACRTLGFLALRNKVNARIIYLSGGVELIIMAMKRFEKNGSVLRFASPALESLGTVATDARERIEELGGVQLAREAWIHTISEDEKLFWRVLYPATKVNPRFIFTDEFLQEH